MESGGIVDDTDLLTDGPLEEDWEGEVLFDDQLLEDVDDDDDDEETEKVFWWVVGGVWSIVVMYEIWRLTLTLLGIPHCLYT